MADKIGVICTLNDVKHIREVGTTVTLCGKRVDIQHIPDGSHMSDAECNKCRKVVGLPPIE